MMSIAQITESTVTVVVPLAIRRRNGRPKIVLPDDGSRQPDATDPAIATVLRAIARAWDWRRRLETGEVDTLQDIADAEKVTLPFVSRFIRLVYLSPGVLDRIVAGGHGTTPSLDRVAASALEPWSRQPTLVLESASRWAPPGRSSLCMQGSDKTGHWSAGTVLSAPE
jgi:hypothetical protein